MFRAEVQAARLVRHVRGRAGLSARALDRKAGTSEGYVSLIERGQRVPSLDVLDRIVDACGHRLRLTVEEGD